MTNQPTIVINDPGGQLGVHQDLGRQYSRSGARLEVVYCASNCWALLAEVPADRICFLPSAWIGSHTRHQAADGTESTTTMIWERGRDLIRHGYRSCSP